MERRKLARPQRVLVADDADDVRELWKAWLTFWGFAVDEARNGAEAVEKARRHPPDLVLMDVWMPVMTGVEATERIKADSELADVPVLALTAAAMWPPPEEVTTAGCDRLLRKPIDPDELLAAIRGLLKDAPSEG
jgi:CheY-like chemotaxis protein